LNEMSSKFYDQRLDRARDRLDSVTSAAAGNMDPEAAKKAMDDIQEARRLLACARLDHLAEMRQLDLGRVVHWFESTVRRYARTSEASAFDNLVKTAQRAIERNTGDFESHLSDLRRRGHDILWRQDWCVIDRFKWLVDSPHLFPDSQEHAHLVALGSEALKSNDMEKLRSIVWQLDSKRFVPPSDEDLAGAVNLLRG
jgi:molecular chaperone DnaK